MEQFAIHTGLVAPLDRKSVDADAIIPKQFLKLIERIGFGPSLFGEWCYKGVDEPSQDNSKRPLNPDFVLDQPCYKGASVLLARKNFGYGSSRERASRTLQQYGFRAIITPSFTDVFFSGCFEDGLLSIVLTESQVDYLFNETQAFTGCQLTVDLDKQVAVMPDGTAYPFDITALREYCLLNGFGGIGLTLRYADQIKAYEVQRLARVPWLAHKLVGWAGTRTTRTTA